MIFSVKFPSGKEVTAHADCEAAALSKAFMDVTRPIYCRIHSEIATNSDAPVGAIGMYYPPSEYPISARLMREVYMDGGYCLVPAHTEDQIKGLDDQQLEGITKSTNPSGRYGTQLAWARTEIARRQREG
jgi:hypothetical protein